MSEWNINHCFVVDDFMIELRPRRRVTSSDRRQSPRVNEDAKAYYADEPDDNNDDETNELHPFLPSSRPIYAVPVTKSLFCVKIIFFFGFSGIIFLSSIAYLLYTDSSYISIPLQDGMSKPDLAGGVFGAVIMYLFVCVVSALVWYNNTSNKQTMKK